MFTVDEKQELAFAANHEAGLMMAMARYHRAVESKGGPNFAAMTNALASAHWHCSKVHIHKRQFLTLLKRRSKS